MTAATLRDAVASVVREPSLTVQLKDTSPLKLAAGVKVQVPFPLLTNVPSLELVLSVVTDKVSLLASDQPASS